MVISDQYIILGFCLTTYRLRNMLRNAPLLDRHERWTVCAGSSYHV